MTRKKKNSEVIEIPANVFWETLNKQIDIPKLVLEMGISSEECRNAAAEDINDRPIRRNVTADED